MRRKKEDILLHELSSFELEAKMVNWRRQGMTVQSIQSLVNKDNVDPQLVLVKAREVENICRSFQNYEMVELIIASDLCKIADKDEYFVYHLPTKKRMLIKASSLNNLFHPDFLYKKAKHLYDMYNPRTPEVYMSVDGQTCFNMYCPPNWFASQFYKQTTLQPCEIPSCYLEFFTHLVDSDEASYQYLLKWLANSLVDRNYCYLVTVGKKGIGKGMLYEITSRLHGINNSGQILGDTFFKTDFNDDLENKTLYYINEVSKVNDKNLDRLKMLVETTLRINGKNQKFKVIDNYVNTMVSSNDIAAIPVTRDERRFSIITLTDTPTLVKWSHNHDDFIKQLLLPQNIAALGAYLLTRVKFTSDEMKRYFHSKKQMQQIESTALEDWEDYFLFQYCKDKAGQIISVADIATDIKNALNNSRVRVSVRILRDLKNRFPGFFTVCAVKREDGSDGATGMKFKPLDEQPKREAFNLEIKESED